MKIYFRTVIFQIVTRNFFVRITQFWGNFVRQNRPWSPYFRRSWAVSFQNKKMTWLACIFRFRAIESWKNNFILCLLMTPPIFLKFCWSLKFLFLWERLKIIHGFRKKYSEKFILEQQFKTNSKLNKQFLFC